MKVNVEERVTLARKYFSSGYNCAQSVALAYSDVMGVDPQIISNLSAPFGGGLGRMREVCGAVSGMSMVVGTLSPALSPADRVAKNNTAAMTKELAEEFKAKNSSIVCRELLKSNKRPCAELVEQAAEILANKINAGSM